MSAKLLANDPSLKYHPMYLRWEALDTDRGPMRFQRYAADGRIVLATLNGCAELPGSVDPLMVRRRPC